MKRVKQKMEGADDFWFNSDFSKLLTVAFAYLVQHITHQGATVEIMSGISRRSKHALSSLLWIIDPTEMILILWVIWVSSEWWRCTREGRGPCWNTDIRSSLLVVGGSCSFPHHQLHLISSQTGGLESLGFIFTLAVITPAPLRSCLHSRNHTHITSAKCFLYVCAHWWECVGGRVWRRGRSGIASSRLW